MLDPQTERLIKAIFRELSARRNLWIVVAMLVSAAALFVAFTTPKVYESTGSILVENRNIVGPLMDGVAEQTEVAYMASIVSEIAFSRRILETILDVGELIDESTSGQEKERLMASLRGRTNVRNRGRNLITISYRDQEPQRAYEVANMYVDWIIRESLKSQREESLSAFRFIDSQVQEYQRKLVESEMALREFRDANMDALPESSRQVGERAMGLRRESESLRLEISELNAQEMSLVQQLSSETQVTNAAGKQTQIRTRLAEFETQLATLRLSYHDTYPDIVQIKGQIDQLRAELSELESVAGVAGTSGTGAEGTGQDLYGDLRSRLADIRTRQSSVAVRLRELESLLSLEIDRSQKIGESEQALTELNRDYQVNQDIYQDLLRRREKARVSMTMDQEQQGLIMSVQEPPAVPYTPVGLRFLHIAGAGLVLSFLLPLGITTLLVQFDPRVRMKEQIEQLQVPVLSVISDMKTAGAAANASSVAFILGVLALAAMYGAAAWLKFTGIES
ncbi:MAG: XrtA system polysaccharide chain length determinant [Pseudomonadota bacterium]